MRLLVVICAVFLVSATAAASRMLMPFHVGPFAADDAEQCEGVTAGTRVCSSDCLNVLFCMGSGTAPIPVETCDTANLCYLGKCTAGNADCPQGEESIKCTGKGVFPDPSKCTHYHLCMGNVDPSKSGECDEGWAFDSTTASCSLKTDDERCQALPIKCNNVGDNQIFPGNPNIYYFCITDSATGPIYPVLYKCPHGGVYNNSTLSCTDATTTSPSPSSDPTSSSSETSTPSSGPTSPSSETSTLSTGPTSPSSETSTPSTGPTSTSSENSTPSSGPTSPSSEASTPSTGPTSPSSETSTPSTGPTSPSSETSTPSTAPTSSSSETSTSSTGPTSTSSENSTPSSGPTSASSETSTPSTGPTSPSSETSTPSTGPTLPTSETSTPSTGPTSPSSETSTPTSSPTSPSSETSTSSSGPTMPSSETPTTTPPSVGDSCSTPLEIVPDSDSCYGYYRCNVLYMWSYVKCKTGYYFNKEELTCMYGSCPYSQYFERSDDL